jgi:hypothetical protein
LFSQSIWNANEFEETMIAADVRNWTTLAQWMREKFPEKEISDIIEILPMSWKTFCNLSENKKPSDSKCLKLNHWLKKNYGLEISGDDHRIRLR